MRIVVLGTGPFAVPSCRQMVADGHDIPLVVTRPLPESKSKKTPVRPVWDWATEQQLQIFEPNSINEPGAIERLAGQQADLFFVCDYGQILSSQCLTAAGLGGINLHGSLLPRHRGAAPVQWTLLTGDSKAGVSVIHMTPRLDAGPTLVTAATDILPDESAEQLESRLAALGATATHDAIELLARWNGQETIGQLQDKSLVTRAPRFAKADGELDCRLPAEYLVRLVRACQPWPGTFAELSWDSGRSMRLLVRAARSVDDPGLLASKPIGSPMAISASQLGCDWPAPWHRLLAVKTGAGLLLISRLQPAGKREMTAEEFLRGHPLDGDAMFQLPAERLQPMV